MIVRDCAGGVVFCGNKVFLLKNEKGEWVLPKGRIRDGKLPSEVAVERVQAEAGIDAKIVLPAGETSYEFFSTTRRSPVCNRINWFVMEADNEAFHVNDELQYSEGVYLNIADATERATYSQDKALIASAYRRYQETNN